MLSESLLYIGLPKCTLYSHDDGGKRENMLKHKNISFCHLYYQI